MSLNKIFINPHLNPTATQTPPNPVIRAFHESLPHYSKTPLISLPELAKDLGVAHVLLKDEGDRLGLKAFKILGASWATARAIIEKLELKEEAKGNVKADGSKSAPTSNSAFSASAVSIPRLAAAAQAAKLVLYAATDGNHGRAVARMAQYLGIEARINVPRMLDEEAISKIQGEGATVVVYDGDYDATVLATKAEAKRHPGGRGLLISDTALEAGDVTAQWIVDGYQTMFDEIEEQVVEVTGQEGITHVLTPVGVGSLTQAVITHFGRGAAPESSAEQSSSSSSRSRPSIITVEPAAAACLQTSLEAGEMTTVAAGYTICSGMCCGTLSVNAWPLLRESVAAAVTVGDAVVDDAVRELQRYGVRAGPCGAATLAGLRQLASNDASEDEQEEVHLGSGDVVLVLCTEGERGYELRE